MKRRTFLKGTVGGLGGLAGMPAGLAGVSPGFAPANAGEQGDFPRDNYQMPDWLRYARTIYFDGYSPPVYPHLKDFDAKRLLQTVVELGGDTLRFQPIGYWASYPSKVLRVHPELGSRDLIEEVAGECRRLGVHHYCYTGYGHPHMEIGWVDKHPKYADWVLRGPNGEPYGQWWHIGWGLRQYLCVTGDAFRAAIREIVRELCGHDIDGVYFDCPSGYRGICFCDSCRRSFKKFSGMDIDQLSIFVQYGENVRPIRDRAPSEADMKGLVAWYGWANQLAKEDLLDFRKIIHGSGKFMLCHNGLTWIGTSLRLQYRVPDGFMLESIVETHRRLVVGLMGASMARPYRKLAQMYVGSYSIGEPSHEHPSIVHNTNLEDTDEIRMDGFTNLACGNAPIYATANRLYYSMGNGSAEPAREVFALMRKMEPLLKDSFPVSYVTIVPTWESLQLWRTMRRSWNMPQMSEAFGLAMLDHGISFDVVPSTEMSEEWLARQRVIALCGASGISDSEAQMLAAWVEQGGGLLATYDTGMFDEQGQPRRNGGALKEVLGMEIKGEPLDSQPECYYRVKRAHVALGDYAEGAIVLGDGKLVPVEARLGATVLADCWNLGTNESRGPAIIAHTYGKGRTLYISGSLESYYASSRMASIRRLLGSMVSYLAGGELLPFGLVAPRGVYGVLRQTTKGDLALWVLANVGFKDDDIGVMRQEFLPISNVKVSIRLPEGRQGKEMRLIRADRAISFREEDGYAVGTIPTLHIAEVVHLILA